MEHLRTIAEATSMIKGCWMILRRLIFLSLLAITLTGCQSVRPGIARLNPRHVWSPQQTNTAHSVDPVTIEGPTALSEESELLSTAELNEAEEASSTSWTNWVAPIRSIPLPRTDLKSITELLNFSDDNDEMPIAGETQEPTDRI